MRVLDLYCGAGGAARGYQLAGFETTGVDLAPQPNYCGEMFIQGDVIALLPTLNLSGIDFIHASPPCQSSTALTKGTNRGRVYPELIEPTRELLDATGLPYVIENVQGAKVRRDLTLCGEMFGLEVLRHRYFEVSGLDITQPAHKPHRGRVQGWRHGVYHDGPYFAVYGDGGGKGSVAEWQRAMGIDWTDVRLELAEAIPPAYTYCIGSQAVSQLQQKDAA